MAELGDGMARAGEEGKGEVARGAQLSGRASTEHHPFGGRRDHSAVSLETPLRWRALNRCVGARLMRERHLAAANTGANPICSRVSCSLFTNSRSVPDIRAARANIGEHRVSEMLPAGRNRTVKSK